ncbi:gamma-soluble NSF attachment protein [Tribolium castaneum]|uniref:Gamma-soluble NSF attachment protein n=1 Tax=Tribolium castaneum TaxID=7070 RepID=D6WIT9_TRICA|nr:PREDICTED: gamma-soluble NSF attachment protein [Tribolium castaneum]EEZ99648.1 Gamma-soluble NSF attachment protein-like Protein [Tribolium castaneum]|eukprot:XP_967815.1 PREDICTED: gamma-soluble NSF attachment protein [Tribolium castaneum]
MSANKKNEEGLEHIRNAEKHLKTSLLKWRPDYESAADDYNKAATCFRNAKNFAQCKECLLKAVDCHKQNRALFSAAKALDQAVLVCKELGDLQDVASLAERAANMFQSHGSADTAAASLDKAAKILEAQHPEQALRLFQHASEIAMIQDSSRQAAEYVSKVARLHVKLQQYDLAADAIRRELGLHQQNESYQATGRLAVALVLVQLARGDVVAAEKAFKEWGNYCEAPEVQTLEMLLQAYDEEDPEAAKRALSNPFIKHMDVEYAILARDMPLPEGIATPPKATVRENAAPSYVSPNSQTTATIEDRPEERGEAQGGASDDELEGGLC